MRTAREVAVFVHRHGHLLLLRRARDGIWHVPAGVVEDGESDREAAARELGEETGLQVTSAPDDLMCTQQYPPRPAHEYPAGLAQVTLENFAVEAPADWSPGLDAEHTEYRWAAFEEARDLLHFDEARRTLAVLSRSALAGRQLELWSRLRSRVQDVEALLTPIGPEAWQTSCADEGWPVWLVACHIALGLRRQAKWIELVLAGRRPHGFSWDRAHALNALVARRGTRPDRAQVLRALREASQRWRELLVRATDADLARIAFDQEGRQKALDWVAGVLAPRHVDEHLRSMRTALVS